MVSELNEDQEFALSLSGLVISCLIILIFIIITNVNKYKEDPKSFLLKVTPNKYFNYVISSFLFFYTIFIYSIIEAGKYILAYPFIAIFIITIVLVMYIGSIVWLSKVSESQKDKK